MERRMGGHGKTPNLAAPSRGILRSRPAFFGLADASQHHRPAVGPLKDVRLDAKGSEEDLGLQHGSGFALGNHFALGEHHQTIADPSRETQIVAHYQSPAPEAGEIPNHPARFRQRLQSESLHGGPLA